MEKGVSTLFLTQVFGEIVMIDETVIFHLLNLVDKIQTFRFSLYLTEIG